MTGWALAAAWVVQQAAVPPPPAQPPREPVVVVHGDASALAVYFPKQDDAAELRSRARLQVTVSPRTWLRIHLDGLAEGLVADRSGGVRDAAARLREAWVELRGERAELRAGYGRIVWGRLDEVQPSDVINPLDIARFFLDGRSEARLPVGLLRGRAFLTPATTLEAVIVSSKRRGRFDELDEASSPFNLLRNVVVIASGGSTAPSVHRVEPKAAWRNLQPGLRLSSTAGRVDFSLSAFRGFESFGLISFESSAPLSPGASTPGAGVAPSVVGSLVERYRRFTMLAGDFETVAGDWAIRGEVAAFVDKTLGGASGPVAGKALDVGVGADRSVGAYRLFGSVVWHREWSAASPSFTRSHVNVIGSVERRFARDRYLARVFGVGNPEDKAAFVRGVLAWSVRDNVALEVSGGTFLGTGTDSIFRFNDRDFVFARLRYHF